MVKKFLTLQDVQNEIQECITQKQITNKNIDLELFTIYNSLAMCYKQQFSSFNHFFQWCYKKKLINSNVKEITLALRGRYEASPGVYPKIEYETKSDLT